MMNVDIQTEHVAMRPEWRRMIDAWIQGCRKHHPEIREIDLTLRHDAQRRAAEEVDVVATARGRRLRAARQAQLMSVALQDALETLERELLVHEAVGRQV